MQGILDRLKSTEEKVSIIRNNYCNQCILNRRTNITNLHTPGNELDANIWQSKDIFGLSVNIFLCNKEKNGIISYKDDVNITPIATEDDDFTSNEQLDTHIFNNIEFRRQNTLILSMIINEIESTKGTFPFKKGSPDEEIYDFKLQVQYIPKVLNVFHFQIEVMSNQSSVWKKVARTNNKKYIRSLASKIRNQILEEKKIKPLNTNNS